MNKGNIMENMGKELKQYLNNNPKKADLANKVLEDAYNDSKVETFIEANRDKLASDFKLKSASKVFEYVNQKQRIKNGEKSMTPGYIPTLVLDNGYIDIAYQPSEKTRQQAKIVARNARIHAINMPKAVRAATFDNLAVTPERNAIVNMLIDWLNNYLMDPEKYQRAYYIYGDYGVGKTYLMGALANELADHGINVTMVHFPTFAVEMRNSIGNTQIDTMGQIQQIKQAPILILDDIGAESMSQWIRDDVLGIILEYRMQNELPTFFTANFEMQQLQDEQLTETKQAHEPVKAARLMQRIKFLAIEYLLTGENRRLGN